MRGLADDGVGERVAIGAVPVRVSGVAVSKAVVRVSGVAVGAALGFFATVMRTVAGGEAVVASFAV